MLTCAKSMLTCSQPIYLFTFFFTPLSLKPFQMTVTLKQDVKVFQLCLSGEPRRNSVEPLSYALIK